VNPRLARAPLLVALAFVLSFLVLGSSLTRLVPLDLAAWPFNLLVFLVVLGLLAPALLARGSPLPLAVAVALPLVTLAAYGESKLDWLRTLKDFGVSEGGVSAPRLMLALLALALLWALHAIDFALRLRERALSRGVPEVQASLAFWMSVKRSGAAAGFALGVTALLAVLVLAAAALGDRFDLGAFAFVVPLVATALVVAGAVVLIRGSANQAE